MRALTSVCGSTNLRTKRLIVGLSTRYYTSIIYFMTNETEHQNSESNTSICVNSHNIVYLYLAVHQTGDRLRNHGVWWRQCV